MIFTEMYFSPDTNLLILNHRHKDKDGLGLIYNYVILGDYVITDYFIFLLQTVIEDQR